MTSGERIKNLLKQKNMTQAELAKRINTTPQRLTEWIIKNRQPSTKYLEKMAKIFDVSIDYILTGNETQTAENEFAKIRKEAEQKIIDDYNSLDEDGKRQLEDFFQYLKSKYVDKK